MRCAARSLLTNLGLALVVATASAQEQTPPPVAPSTSGEASLLSGRTLGTGEVMMAGAIGWPGLWVQIELAPVAGLAVGIRVALLYGSPVMALVPGVGAELAVPLRIHVHGEGAMDLALFVTPAVTMGEGALAGEGGGVWAGDVGWSTRVEAGLALGLRVAERLTFLAGAGGHAALVHTPSAGDPDAAGAIFARTGLEGLISRDTMLFAEVHGGAGFAPERSGLPLFGATVSPFLRVSLGLAYVF